MLDEIPYIRTRLGAVLTVDGGESADITATFTNPSGTTVDPADFATAELSLFVWVESASEFTIVNGVEDADVNDTGRGTISGTSLVLRLDSPDTDPVGSGDEIHAARLVVTYSDGVGTRTSKKFARYNVCQPAVLV